MNQRPLSPHLQVYRFGLGMMVSILHRFTGVALSVGALIGIFSLLRLSQGADAYTQWLGLLKTPLGTVVRVGVVLALVYHAITGVRHLIFDTGLWMERAAARRSAQVVIASFVVLSLIVLLTWVDGGGL